MTLVCMRADAELAARGSVFDRVCSKCSARVMLAPSGQAFLKNDPDAAILCNVCYGAVASLDNLPHPAAPIETILQEIKTSGPNPYRRRN
jgi:hypothetical protein